MKHPVFVLFLACFLIVPFVFATDTVFIPGGKILMAEDFSATPLRHPTGGRQ